MGKPREAGRELDAEIAERVMGIVPCSAWRYANLGSAGGPVSINDGCEHATGTCFPSDHSLPFGGPAHYSTDIAAAWLVVEKMAEQWKIDIQNRYAPTWGCHVHFPAPNYAHVFETARSAPLAVCLAALAAIEVCS